MLSGFGFGSDGVAEAAVSRDADDAPGFGLHAGLHHRGCSEHPPGLPQLECHRVAAELRFHAEPHWEFPCEELGYGLDASGVKHYSWRSLQRYGAGMLVSALANSSVFLIFSVVGRN